MDPNYAFTISAPKGWKLTSTKELQAAFYPADTSFEKSAVVMYARSADKKGLGVSNVQELNRLGLKGIQDATWLLRPRGLAQSRLPSEQSFLSIPFPAAATSKSSHTRNTKRLSPFFVLSADKDEQLKAARPAFDELISSYLFISDSPQTPKKLAKPNKKQQPSRK